MLISPTSGMLGYVVLSASERRHRAASQTSREVEFAGRDTAALLITGSLHDLAVTSSWEPEYASCLALKLVSSAESPRLWRFEGAGGSRLLMRAAP